MTQENAVKAASNLTWDAACEWEGRLMANLERGLDTYGLEALINNLSDILRRANSCDDSAGALQLGAEVSALFSDLESVAADFEEDALEAEEEEEEWEPDYDDDFPMYLEYDDWKEDNHPGLDIERDF